MPALQADEDVVLSFALADDIDGTPQLVKRNVHGFKISIGAVDARPTSGGIQIKIGSGSAVVGTNVTTPIAFNATAETLEVAFNALTGGLEAEQKPVTCEAIAGSWVVRTANGTQLSLSVFKNTLQPLSRLMIGRTQIDDGSWSHALRLTQYPIAFTDVQARKVPPVPTVIVTRSGVTNEGVKINQTVEIDFSAGFRGSYYLGLMGRETKELQVEDANGIKVDGPAQLQAALNEVGAPDGGEFLVTAPRNNIAKIEYIGAYAGNAFAAPSFHIVSAPEGDITATLSLKKDLFNRYVASRLAIAPAVPVTAQMQISAKLGSETDDAVREWHTLWKTAVELEANINTDDLETVPSISWLRGPDARDYILRSTDSIVSGSQHNEDTFGDGTATEFDWDHALDSDDLIFSLKENVPNGLQLANRIDYEVRFVDSNHLVVTMLGDYATTPPGVGALRAEVITVDQRAVFLEHTHTIAEINGLQTLLNAQSSAITALQGKIGEGSFSTPTNGTTDKVTSKVFTFNDYVEIFGLRSTTALSADTSFENYDTSKLSRNGGGLFPAIHATAVTGAIPTDFAARTRGLLYQNQTGSLMTLPGGFKHRSMDLLANEYAAWDGMWYKVAKEVSGESTYYPVDFVRELFNIVVLPNQFRLGFELQLRMALELVTFLSPVKMHYMLVIEHGTVGADTSPGTPGANLGSIVWNTTPILAEQLVIGKTAERAEFGCKLQNKSSGIVGLKLAYGGESAAGSVPSSNKFALRCRLVRPDTENRSTASRGYIGFRGLKAQAGTTSSAASQDDSLGKCIIQQI